MTPAGMIIGAWTMTVCAAILKVFIGSITLVPLVGFAVLLTALMAGVGYWHFRRAIPYYKGAEGERAVRDALDLLRPLGYEAVHDIVLKNGNVKYNIDHVLVGPGGVFAVETKFASKHDGGSPKVEFDGNRVRLTAELPSKEVITLGPWDAGPVDQARRNAKDVRRIVQERTGMDLPVRAAVVYPGWYGSDRKDFDVWVMGATYFVGAVERVRAGVVDPKDVKRVVGVLRDVGED